MVMMNVCAGQQWICRHKRTDLWSTAGERKDRVARIEREAWKHIHYVKQPASENLLCDTRSSTQRSVTPWGRGGWGGRWERVLQRKRHMYTCD